MSSSEPINYKLLTNQLIALTESEPNTIANLANASALLFNTLGSINWAGFYVLDDNELVLGPFQGKPACVRIPMGKGVCGTAAQTQSTLVVDNVHEFEGHIACDVQSQSEIVIPLITNGTLVGVLDVDSPVLRRFDHHDKEGLETFARAIEASCITSTT